MSKAEERAYECFPNEDIESKKARFGFLLGYNQAEKDLELTWEDIKVIEKLLGFDNIIESPKEFYQEILKRFNKERKEK